MDAKLLPDRPISVSGRNLFLILGAALMGAALLLDSLAGRFPSGQAGLALPLAVSALLTALLGFQIIPILRAWKAGQFIREDGPQAHLKKAGTPTMGGLFVIPVAVVLALVWSGFEPKVVAVGLMTLFYAAIGWLDDWQILRQRSNKGISPRVKLMLQIGFAAIFCLWVLWTQPFHLTTQVLPLGLTLPLGFLFLPIAGFALVAESNATNLTDGLDGLAAGTGAIALLSLGALVAPTSPGLMIFCACMSGAYLGFLAHNHNPATVFMGDTGSLALGGGLAAVAILSQSLFALLLLSGIFLVETVSVIAQVGYFKATKNEQGVGKRLFKMAPLHHHLELSGWSETQVVGRFYLIGGLLAVLCLWLYSS